MKKTFLVLFALGAVSLLSVTPAFSLTLSFAPGSQTISQGSATSVDIVATFGQVGEIVAAYDFDIAYNPLILTSTAVGFTTNLGSPDSFVDANWPAPGIIDLAEVSFLSDADLLSLQGSGPITLATLYFTGSGPGTSALSFVNYGLSGNDIKGAGNIAYTLGPNGDLTLTDGSITVVTTGVPEPATMLLLGLGLVGLAGMRRRK